VLALVVTGLLQKNHEKVLFGAGTPSSPVLLDETTDPTCMVETPLVVGVAVNVGAVSTGPMALVVMVSVPEPDLLTATLAVTRAMMNLPCKAEVRVTEETLLFAVDTAGQLADQVAVSQAKKA
jgi:hypothetical protein